MSECGLWGQLGDREKDLLHECGEVNMECCITAFSMMLSVYRKPGNCVH